VVLTVLDHRNYVVLKYVLGFNPFEYILETIYALTREIREKIVPCEIRSSCLRPSYNSYPIINIRSIRLGVKYTLKRIPYLKLLQHGAEPGIVSIYEARKG
jgi:hypothetical protein